MKTNETVTIYKVNDEHVVNVVFYFHETNKFEYVPVSEIDERTRVCESEGLHVVEKEVPMGKTITIPLSSAPKDDPYKDYADQDVSATISIIPKRYKKSDMPKEFISEGVSLEQYSKLMGEKELVVEIHSMRLSKNPLGPSTSGSDKSKDKNKFVEVKNKYNKIKSTDNTKPSKSTTTNPKPSHSDPVMPNPMQDVPLHDVRYKQQDGMQF